MGSWTASCALAGAATEPRVNISTRPIACNRTIVCMNHPRSEHRLRLCTLREASIESLQATAFLESTVAGDVQSLAEHITAHHLTIESLIGDSGDD